VKALDGPQGVVSFLASVFGNVDAVGDRMMPGAFKASLQRKLPAVVWSHDWTQPIGKALDARELTPYDPRLPAELASQGGLWVEAQLNLDTQRGRDAYCDLKFGAITQFSIGYIPVKSTYDNDGVRELKEVDLFEVSPVLVGANDQTRLLSVKNRLVRRLERKYGKTISADTAAQIPAAIESIEASAEMLEALLGIDDDQGQGQADADDEGDTGDSDIVQQSSRFSRARTRGRTGRRYPPTDELSRRIAEDERYWKRRVEDDEIKRQEQLLDLGAHFWANTRGGR
jgi:HK97 family phage prohead protease